MVHCVDEIMNSNGPTKLAPTNPNKRKKEFDEQIESVAAITETSNGLVKAQRALDEISHVLLDDKATKATRESVPRTMFESFE